MASWGVMCLSFVALTRIRVDGRNRLELHFLESALPENSDWISCSGCENSRSSGKNRILTQNREKLEMTVPISFHNELKQKN
ncbi:hypothetical protein VEE65_44380 (plasmid) [Escherichia coli]|nr:hypothetical protein VEE65_44380 [Escherichia coli]